MSLKINGVEILDMKINGVPLLDAKINDAALWPTTPAPPPAPMGNLYGRMKALSTRETITHFKTVVDVGGFLKYRVYPTKYSEGVIGTLLAEAAPLLVAGDGVNRIPLVRGFEVISSSQFRLRQAGGDNTTYTDSAGASVGVNTGAVEVPWSNYVSARYSANDGIYIMDITARVWVMLNPRQPFGGTFGSSFWNIKIQNSSNAGHIRSSFDVPGATNSLANAVKLQKIQAWLAAIRADTKKREFVIMIAEDKAIVPVF